MKALVLLVTFLALIGVAVPSVVFGYSVTPIELFTLQNTGQSSVATILIEDAGYANSNELWLYKTNTPGTKLRIFSGPQGPGASATLTWNLLTGVVTHQGTGQSAAIGLVFGFALKNQPGNWFYTQTSLNADGFNHFKKEVGTALGEYALRLGIEDLLGGGDRDYNDMRVGVSNVRPIPEPMTIASLLFAGLGLMMRRRFMK